MSTVLTLSGPAEYREDVRKSRFLAQAAPIEDAAGALAFVARVSDPTANPNCWAYRIGNAYRYHDDGEPGGTAGRPILQAIEGQDCDRVVVVVTRWFGGVLLGTGGLVRAYGGCAAACLRLADKRPWVALSCAVADCTFAEAPVVRVRIAEAGALVADEAFHAEGVRMVLTAPAQATARVDAILADLTRGRLALRWSAQA